MANPHTIILIRHGEKPHDGGPPHGVNSHGEHDGHSLSVRGWTRAGALAAMFAHTPHASHPLLVAPQRIFATRSTHAARSTREFDTATPIARRLGLHVDDSVALGSEAELAQLLLDGGDDALVVWHHGQLLELVRALPVANPEDVPAQWPDERFDLYWILTTDLGDHTATGLTYRFSVVPQRLLDGDEED